MGRRVLSLPDPLYVQPEDDDWHSISKETLSNRARHLSMTIQHFWKRWRGEYLLQLREYHRQKMNGKPQPPKLGDMVLVHNEKHLRGL